MGDWWVAGCQEFTIADPYEKENANNEQKQTNTRPSPLSPPYRW